MTARFIVRMGLAVLFAASACAWAQTSQQSPPPLRPTESVVDLVVTDQSGAVVANASVSIRDVETGKRIAGSTNESGRFHTADLAGGKYEVTVKSRGFKPSTVTADLGLFETRQMTIMLLVAPTIDD
ncbi:MAG TPA: carboxypeptidase-like regulatory domain-containing protein [Candidatus Sulfotelmatobacter sp.]|jgi:hypothetical protein|nr:carboxypeptidase-like regulatory domain-containing protein [Candidatus Sulfotelmatobacter sp.]